MFDFKLIEKNNLDLNKYYHFPKKSIFTTLPWINYLESYTGGKLAFIEIRKENQLIGYLTGIIINKFGIRIFGSPFKGWGTEYMGFDLYDYNNCERLLEETFEYILKSLKCQYIEIVDRNIKISRELKGKFSYKTDTAGGIELDISRNEEDIFSSFKKDCRNFIRQFEKKGAVLKEVPADEAFAERYCEHLKDVFAKQGLVPTYDKERVIKLFNTFKDSENITCIEIESPDGVSIACSIVFHYNGYCYTWGTASEREYQFYRPNETIRWHTIKKCKSIGCHTMDMCGRRAYKYKFAPYDIDHLRIMVSRYKILFFMRDSAQKLYSVIQRIKGICGGKK